MQCPTCQHENTAGLQFCAECGRRLGAAEPASGATGALPAQSVLQERYVITGKLGQGGMGAVYRASDRRLSTATWAVKEMSQAAITGPLERQQARQSFLREAELLAGLSHPNLPRVTDHFEQDGKAYLVMEFVPGETLLSYLARTGLPQPPARVAGWFHQLCDVLDYLHRQNPPIIFRDLKPANIMLTPSGQIKLVDFGIARLFKPGQAQDTQTFGTVGYSSPEQYGHGQTDARSDVYALGVLLHQMLTGHDPISTPFRLPDAQRANPRLPRALADALAVATDSEPSRRFASIRAFERALAGLLEAPDAAQPPGAGSQPFTPPVAAEVFTTQTTVLANSSRWVGIASLAVMALALLIVGVAALQGSTSNALAGIAYILAFAPLLGGPAGATLGVVALTRPQTGQTSHGRRDAAIGIASGLATLLLCCAIAALAGAGAGPASTDR